MDCIICAYTFDGHERLPSLVECGHNNICSLCFLRIRALQRNFHCPSCKKELDNVICTDKPDAKFEDFQVWGDSIGPEFVLDAKSQMFFPNTYYRSKAQKLWSYKCSICRKFMRDMKSLRAHVNTEHNMHICSLCIDNKQVFPSEQKMYTQKQYDVHLRQGDKDGSQGHPSCEFCRKRFYDSTALFVHLTKDHYSCHICDRNGLKYKYYKDYRSMEDHFRKVHRLCEDPGCLAKKFVVFENDIDFEVHNRQWHPSFKVHKKSTIQLDFKLARSSAANVGSTISRRDEGEEVVLKMDADAVEASSTGASALSAGVAAADARSGSDAGDHRYEGGVRGRAIDGEWQVELQPASADPRDVNRNAHITLSGPGTATSSTTSSNAVVTAAAAAAIEDQEEFPTLGGRKLGDDASAGITLTNRWVSMGGSGGQNVNKKNIKKNDFPALKSTYKTAGTSKVNVVTQGTSALSGGGHSSSSSSSSTTGTSAAIMRDYASLSNSSSSSNNNNNRGSSSNNNNSTSGRGGLSESLGAWGATLKQDKKKATGKQSSSQKPGLARRSSTEDDIELAQALAESAAMSSSTSTPGTSTTCSNSKEGQPSPLPSPPQSTTTAAALDVTPSIPPAAPVPVPTYSAQEHVHSYPSLQTDPGKNKKTSSGTNSTTASKKSTGSSLGGWGSALGSAGIEPKSKSGKKGGKKLTVVHAVKSVSTTATSTATGNKTSTHASTGSGPTRSSVGYASATATGGGGGGGGPAVVGISHLKPMGKLSKDSSSVGTYTAPTTTATTGTTATSSDGAVGYTAPGTGLKKHAGWVSMGGSGTKQAKAAAAATADGTNRATLNDDFPTLGSK